MTAIDRMKLRVLVKTMYDFQDMRVRTAGRLRINKDGEPQDDKNQPDIDLLVEEIPTLDEINATTRDVEAKLAKEITRIVKRNPMWALFFEEVKGVGPMLAAVMLSEFDIHKATTVSKMWQYAGLNSGLVRGKKLVGERGKKTLELTDTMIRGDRLTPGFVAPFNGWLRTKLCGVLADCFIKSKSTYALNYYYPMKNRLEQEVNPVNGTERPWCDESRSHRDRAARRYMIKMFLIDLHRTWRLFEGLPVRPPYAAEYLGKVHDGADYAQAM